jgi:LysM repeat protein
MVVGGITKMYYTIKAGDTLQTIISKFKPQGVTQEILKQLNYAHGLEIKPGNKLRLA